MCELGLSLEVKRAKGLLVTPSLNSEYSSLGGWGRLGKEDKKWGGYAVCIEIKTKFSKIEKKVKLVTRVGSYAWRVSCALITLEIVHPPQCPSERQLWPVER